MSLHIFKLSRAALALNTLAVSAAAAWMLGWLKEPRRWKEASGWNRIPEGDRPPVTSRPVEGGPELYWLGHSGFLLRWRGSTLVLDPNTSGRCTVSRRFLEKPGDVSSLERVDAALISHAHFDHLNVATLSSLPRLDKLVVPAGAEDFLASFRKDGTRVVPIRIDETVRVGRLDVTAVPAAHNGNRLHPLKSRYRAVGYVISDGERRVYFAGDTSFTCDFAAVRERHHPAIAILPIGAFAPRYPLRLHHMNPGEAVMAAKILGVECVVPCHFGTFRLSLDEPSRALPMFAREAAAAGVAWCMPPLWRGPE